MPGPAELLLLRHGQSEWNKARRWQGIADSPLTARGRRQAITAAIALTRNEPPLDAMWSSDLGRAVETATILGEHLGIGEVRLDARLREADAGPWEGLVRDDIDRQWPGYLANHRRPEGFETAESMVERSVEVCRELLGAADGPTRTVVVTHSGFVRALRRHLGAPDLRIPNLGGCWVSWTPAGPGMQLGRLVSLVEAEATSMSPLRGADGDEEPVPSTSDR